MSAVLSTRAAQELVFLVGIILLTVVNVVAGLQRSHYIALRADGCGGDGNIHNSASKIQGCFLVNLTGAIARLFTAVCSQGNLGETCLKAAKQRSLADKPCHTS